MLPKVKITTDNYPHKHGIISLDYWNEAVHPNYKFHFVVHYSRFWLTITW